MRDSGATNSLWLRGVIPSENLEFSGEYIPVKGLYSVAVNDHVVTVNINSSYGTWENCPVGLTEELPDGLMFILENYIVQCSWQPQSNYDTHTGRFRGN